MREHWVLITGLVLLALSALGFIASAVIGLALHMGWLR